MAKYAEGTKTPVSNSQMEVLRILEGHGITQHMLANDSATGTHNLIFKHTGVTYKISVQMPARDAKQFQRNGRGLARSQQEIADAWAAEVRRRWRSFLLVIKAKVIGIDDGVTTFDEAFLPYVVVNEQYETLAEVMVPRIRAAATLGEYPALPMLGTRNP